MCYGPPTSPTADRFQAESNVVAGPREAAYWRWLTRGLYGLVAMIEDSAADGATPPGVAAEVEDMAVRLLGVANGLKKKG